MAGHRTLDPVILVRIQGGKWRASWLSLSVPAMFWGFYGRHLPVTRRNALAGGHGQPAARRRDRVASGTAALSRDHPALRGRRDLRPDRRERAGPGRLHFP